MVVPQLTRYLRLWLLAVVAMPAFAQRWDRPPVPRLDPSSVHRVSGGSPPGTAVGYSNKEPPLFSPTIFPPLPFNTVGDEVFFAHPSPCGDVPVLQRVQFGTIASAGCPPLCDVYFLVYDNADGAFDPSKFIAGFYLANVPTGCDEPDGVVVWEIGHQYPLYLDLEIPIPAGAVGVVVSVAPTGSGGIPFQAPVPGVAPLAAGGGQTIGVSSDVLWCDVSGDGVLQPYEGLTFLSPHRGNLYLELETHLSCPACTAPWQKRAYFIKGTGTNTMWSWRIKSPTAEFDSILNWWGAGPVPNGASAHEIAEVFAQNINDLAASSGCGGGVIHAQAKGHFPFPVNKAELDIYVRATDEFQLYVGPADNEPTCLVPKKPFVGCSFNPIILEVDLSGLDCNHNGIDDAMDVIAGISFDTNGNGIPDECEGGWHQLGDGEPAELGNVLPH